MKTIRVEEVYRIHGTASVSVREDVSLEYVTTRFAREPGARGIFLINADERFVGLITRTALRLSEVLLKAIEVGKQARGS